MFPLRNQWLWNPGDVERSTDPWRSDLTAVGLTSADSKNERDASSLACPLDEGLSSVRSAAISTASGRSDPREYHGFHVRKGLAAFGTAIPEGADLVLNLPSHVVYDFVLGRASIQDALESGEATGEGNPRRRRENAQSTCCCPAREGANAVGASEITSGVVARNELKTIKVVSVECEALSRSRRWSGRALGDSSTHGGTAQTKSAKVSWSTEKVLPTIRFTFQASSRPFGSADQYRADCTPTKESSSAH